MSEVTIVIPHYQARVLGECLAALFAHSDLPIRVLVVDDGQNAPSLQQAVREFPRIEVLRNERRLGFAGACNRGLAAAATPYAVLLNDDTRVTDGWLAPLVAAAERDPVIAACQPKLLSVSQPDTFDYGGGAGGYLDRLGYPFCRGRIFDCRERDQGQYDRQVPLFWACGSALLLRLDAVRQVGFFDLDYFMHFEEIDLCWRLQLAGYRIWAVPDSVVYHHSGFSLPPRSFRKTYLNHRNSLAMLCKNLDWGVLFHRLPLRFLLEWCASLAYLCKGEWSSIAAPPAALLWLLTHPLSLLRRRRESRRLLSTASYPASRLAGDGVYAGSVAYRHFIRGTNRASELMAEEPER